MFERSWLLFLLPIPFLWIVPLSIYLLTFILCFESHRWYQRRIFVPIYQKDYGTA